MRVLVSLLLLAGLQVVPAQAQGNIFTVNATGDESDLEPGDGVCLTTQEECTLRAAMEEANATANEGGPDVIEFDISGATPHVIQPGSPLPQITEPVVIDGTSEPDYDGSPVVEISGATAGDAPGLDVAFSEQEDGGALTARGLAVVDFARAAFRFADDTGGNVVQGCYVGVRPDGATAAGNNRGLFVSVSAPNTTIGGVQSGEGNIISGNSSRGMDLTAAVMVRGNRIGVDANGDPMGNDNSGVFINADGATIGGTGDGEENVVAHNGGDGVEVVDITPPNVQNVIRGNRIFANEGLGIDLEGGTEDAQGRTENDGDDADDGQNRLQNFPVLQASEYNPNTGEMAMTYLVPSDPAVDAGGSSSYPLAIDFYLADTDAEEGRAYLGTDTYSNVDPDDYGGCGAPPCAVTTTFTPQSPIERADNVVATATDDNGNTSEFSPAVLVDFPPPEVTLNQSAEAPEQGNALDVTVSVPEGFVPTEQELFYRQVGTQDFQSTDLEATGELSYGGTIPGSAVTERGLQYYVQLSDGTTTTTVPEGGAEAPRYVPVQISQLTADVTLNPSEYRMISVPIRLDTTNALAQLRDDFGEIDRTEWRLLRWSPQAEEYEEMTTLENASGSGGGSLVPGRAYWLITRSGQPQDGRLSFDVGSGRSVPAAPVPIEVPPGWSQVANPRPYPVGWASVEGQESVMDPVAYAPSASDSTNFGVEVLGPWAGYWVFNPGESAVQLSVPPQEADVGASQMIEKRQTSSESALFGDGSMFDVRPTYALRLAARLERTEAPDLRDAQNVVGVADAGRPGAQTEDVAEPPPIGKHLRLSVVEETPGGRPVDLAGSLRPPSAEGQTWDVKVSTSGAGEKPHTVRGRLQARGALPQGFERRLMDRGTGRSIPIEENGTFTLQLTDERSVRHLRLIVGAEGFAEAESESIRPDRTGLRAVYPNPSRGPVSVDYHLKEGQRVKVQVYDLLGRMVKTLVSGEREAGHYTTRWNPTNVASGIYLVRLQTESTSATQRVSVVH